MSNKIYEGGFYNEYQKERYLRTLTSKSVKQSHRILSRAKGIEEQFDTDLYNFNLYQVENLLNYLEPTTLNASRANFYVIQNYIRWAIEQDISENKMNPLDLLGDTIYFKRFIDNTKKALYTRDEIYRIVDNCENAQDAVPIIAIFEGIFGTAGYDELLNLNKDSLLKNNTLLLKDGESERYIKATDKCYSLIEKALNEKTYIKKNGDVKITLKSSPEANLIENNYVLRNVNTRSESDGKADPFLVQRRITAVKGYNEDWVKTLTPYIIRNSGMLWMAKQLYDEHGELGKLQYDEICEQFGIKKIMNNSYEVYNYHRLKEDFLNLEKIKEVYFEDSPEK